MRNVSFAAIGVFSAVSLIPCAHAQDNALHDWSGTYVGGSIGAIDGRAKTGASTSEGFTGSYFTSPDAEQIAGETRGSLSGSQPVAGLFGGIGRQYDHLYLGIEASIDSLHFDESRSSGAVYISNTTGAFVNDISIKADYQAMLRARVGWAQDRWMTYVTGGVAATRIKLDASFTDDFLGPGARGHDTDKETRLGWVAGVGGEYALSDKWSIRAEYLYADYGKVDTSAVVTSPSFPLLANDLKNSVDFRTQSLTIGLSYRF